VQVSAASHTSTAARQTVLAVAKPSAGQSVRAPGQNSPTSHRPAAARQAVPAGAAAAPTHTGLSVEQSVVPSSQGFPVLQAAPGVQPLEHVPMPLQLPSEQAVPVGSKSSVGHVVVEPLHASSTSHSPAAVRHT